MLSVHWLTFQDNSCKRMAFSIVAGIVSVKSFSDKRNNIIDSKFLISDGILSLHELACKLENITSVNCPIRDGIVPVKRLRAFSLGITILDCKLCPICQHRRMFFRPCTDTNNCLFHLCCCWCCSIFLFTPFWL